LGKEENKLTSQEEKGGGGPSDFKGEGSAFSKAVGVVGQVIRHDVSKVKIMSDIREKIVFMEEKKESAKRWTTKSGASGEHKEW